MTTPQKNEKTFGDLGFDPQIKQILAKKQITTPTPIQAQSIPPIMEGTDCIGIAQTGTGKTLAFSLPLVQELMHKKGRALILAPTRELALQIQETLDWFRGPLGITSAVVVGGASMGKQIQQLKKQPRVIIATPGRLIDHLQQKNVNLSDVRFLVFDEADRMFDMGFAPQIREVLSYVPKVRDRQTLLFSATMPDSVMNLIEENMHTPVRIEVAVQGTAAENVQQEIVILDNAHRKTALLELLKEAGKDAVLVFTRTKYQAKNLTKFLAQKGYKAEELHGNRSQPQRKKAIAAMQSKRSQILVATDVAARGIDISHLKLVVNFDLPDDAEDYVHRIGRTGRAGQSGRAVSFVLTDQRLQLREIQKLINESIEQTHLDSVPTAELSHVLKKPQSGGGGGRGRGRGGRSGGGRRGGGQRRGGGNGGRRSGGGNRSRRRS